MPKFQTRVAALLERKAHAAARGGFEPTWLPDYLFDFQRALADWWIRSGRAAVFADCGLGKTPMELVWAENVVRHTARPVLVVAPLAVTAQIVDEAEKFHVDARVSRDGQVRAGARIVVTNYDMLHRFDPTAFAGVVCDESSAIKSFDGERRKLVTEFLRRVPYRALSTATAAPNDYIELGTSSEALGWLGHVDMLNRFFVNDQNTSDIRRQWMLSRGEEPKGWRLKGHAERDFWRWVCSWARAIRRPSDIGFSDTRFVLPELVEREHVVAARTRAPGMLFELAAQGMHEERAEMRRTIVERCERAADLLNAHDQPAVAWCHLNDESALLARLVRGAVEVRGSDSPERKEEAFVAFAKGRVRVLVTKPKIGAWGLNWQHCAHTTFFPSHSYEQYYQAVRRFWRFGQARPVVVDVVTTEGGRAMRDNLRRKARAADVMFSALVAQMNDALAVDNRSTFNTKTEVPPWL